jgi:MerR family mercuric resistance operon transcriptional regulator
MTGLRSSQVARAAGVNSQTLRYYERRGLLAEPDRSLGGHRLYPPEAVTVLRVIKAAQRLGFTLDEVAELLDTGRHRHTRRPKPELHRRPQRPTSEAHLHSGRPDPEPDQHAHSTDSELQTRARAKIAEVEAKIADLRVIADALRAAVDAGCDDLVRCAGEPCCPIPFAPIGIPAERGIALSDR